VLGLQQSRSALFPFPSQSVHIPPVLRRDRCKQRDGERVEIQLFEDRVDEVRPVAVACRRGRRYHVRRSSIALGYRGVCSLGEWWRYGM
jgi:hypothetical protein